MSFYENFHKNSYNDSYDGSTEPDPIIVLNLCDHYFQSVVGYGGGGGRSNAPAHSKPKVLKWQPELLIPLVKQFSIRWYRI